MKCIIIVLHIVLNKLTLLQVCGFTAQLVEHRTSIVEVTGSNPVEGLVFFRLLRSSCLNWKFTAMITLHFQCSLHSVFSLTVVMLGLLISRKEMMIKLLP